MLKKCEVLSDRVSLIVGKGSIVLLDERQFELARRFVKPIEAEKAEKPEKPVQEESAAVKEKPKKKSK